MPLTAAGHVRKMRGGAQAHLLEADDGHWYVVKFRNNPQHRRVLVNELLASKLLAYLRISAPETALQVPRLTLEGNVPGLEQFNAGITRVNDLLYGFQDFAVIGWK